MLGTRFVFGALLTSALAVLLLTSCDIEPGIHEIDIALPERTYFIVNGTSNEITVHGWKGMEQYNYALAPTESAETTLPDAIPGDSAVIYVNKAIAKKYYSSDEENERNILFDKNYVFDVGSSDTYIAAFNFVITDSDLEPDSE